MAVDDAPLIGKVQVVNAPSEPDLSTTGGGGGGGEVTQGTVPWITEDEADGNPGAAAPALAIQVAGTDGTDLRALLTDDTGVLQTNAVVTFPGSLPVTQDTSPWVTEDVSDGTPGSTAPVTALEVGGVDPDGDLQALSTDIHGVLNVNADVTFPSSIAVTQDTSPWITQDEADGTPGTTPPALAIQVAGVDVSSGDLEVLTLSGGTLFTHDDADGDIGSPPPAIAMVIGAVDTDGNVIALTTADDVGVLNTQDAADGTIGSTTPTIGIQTAGVNPEGNLTALSTDDSGDLNVNVVNTPTVNQGNPGTSPWPVAGTVRAQQSLSWTVAATQSGTWTVAATVTGTVAATQSGSWTVTADQGGSWSVSVTGTVAVTQSGSWTVAATQSGSWTVSATVTGTVAATQSGAWTVAATQSGAWSVTVTGTVAVTQSTSPWVVAQNNNQLLAPTAETISTSVTTLTETAGANGQCVIVTLTNNLAPSSIWPTSVSVRVRDTTLGVITSYQTAPPLQNGSTCQLYFNLPVTSGDTVDIDLISSAAIGANGVKVSAILSPSPMFVALRVDGRSKPLGCLSVRSAATSTTTLQAAISGWSVLLRSATIFLEGTGTVVAQARIQGTLGSNATSPLITGIGSVAATDSAASVAQEWDQGILFDPDTLVESFFTSSPTSAMFEIHYDLVPA
jgi:hypothetical protein